MIEPGIARTTELLRGPVMVARLYGTHSRSRWRGGWRAACPCGRRGGRRGSATLAVGGAAAAVAVGATLGWGHLATPLAALALFAGSAVVAGSG